MTVVKQMRNLAMLAALAVGQTTAMAQVVVTYGPDVASVPTLSEWGMVIMSVLLAVVAVIAVRKKTNSKTVLSIALAAIVSFGAFSEFKWLGAAWANGFATYSMTNATGGQVSVPTSQEFAYVLNSSSIPQRVISIAPQYPQPQAIDDKPACVPGLLVAPNTACALRTNAPG